MPLTNLLSPGADLPTLTVCCQPISLHPPKKPVFNVLIDGLPSFYFVSYYVLLLFRFYFVISVKRHKNCFRRKPSWRAVRLVYLSADCCSCGRPNLKVNCVSQISCSQISRSLLSRRDLWLPPDPA